MLIDVNTVTELLTNALWLIPVITAVVQLVKTTLAIQSRWVPASAVVVGILVSILTVGVSRVGILVGLILGLASSGLYDVGTRSLRA